MFLLAFRLDCDANRLLLPHDCSITSKGRTVTHPLYSRLHTKQKIYGVFDLDNAAHNAWTEHDQAGLEAIADLLVKGCDWPF